MSGYMYNTTTGRIVFMVKDEIKLIRRCRKYKCRECPSRGEECEDFINNYGIPEEWEEYYD